MIIDNQDRKKLGEGRSYGFGFSVLKKIKSGEFETIMPFTACKDYLNDCIYVEYENKPLGKIFGFKHEYIGILKDKKYFYIGLTPVHHKGGNEWNKFTELVELIPKAIDNLIVVINKFEEKFNIKRRSKVELIESGVTSTAIIKVPIFWAKYNFLVSLYTLIIRTMINVDEKLLTKDLKDIIFKDYEPFLNQVDKMLYLQLYKIVHNDLYDKLMDFEYPDPVNSSFIHNNGINHRVNSIKV